MRGASAAALVALATVGFANAQPDACSGSSSSSTLLAQDNDWCSTMNQVTAKADMTTCCGNEAGQDARRALFGESRALRASRELQSDAPVCRSVNTETPYCDPTTNSVCEGLLGADDVLTVDLVMESQSQEGLCCEVCTCYGDPECIAFDGTKSEWIVCDARHPETCQQTQRQCNKQRDHAENSCVWKADDWVDFETSGSPCQPNWTVSGFPTMTMYDADGFKLDLLLGERGVILEAMMDTSDGASYKLNAQDCMDQASDPPSAWQSSTGSIPSSWRWSTPNAVETWWHVNDDGTGIFVDIVCTHSAGSSRPRLNIQNLIETRPDRPPNAAGFCATGNISEKAGTTRSSSWKHEFCLRQNLPSMLVACKYLVDEQCRQWTLEESIDMWCENADLSRTDAAGDVEACKSLLKSGRNVERTTAWTTLVCQTNQLDVDQCLTEVSQFGWPTFLQTHSDGMVDKGNALSTCASSVSQYGPSASGDICKQGVSVEYLMNGDWVQEFFIPSDMPPCGDQLVITAEAHPNLFVYPIRFAQCDLSSECLVANSCRPVIGVSVALQFATTNCPTASPSVSPTTSPTFDTCEPTVVPGTLVDTDSMVPGETFEVSLDVEFNKVEPGCSEGRTSIAQLGCGEPLMNVYALPCSTDIEVEVYTTGGETVVCKSSSAFTPRTSTEVVVYTTQTELVVTVGGAEICSETLPSPPGLPSGGDDTPVDVCTYLSAPSKPAADVCASASTTVVKVPTATPTESPTPLPTSSPTCATTITPGNQAGTLLFENSLEVTFDIELNALNCDGETANVIQIGCTDMIAGVNIRNCSSALEFMVKGTAGDAICTSEEIGVGNSVTATMRVRDGELVVVVGGVDVCSKTIPGGQVAVDDTGMCIYQSGPGMPSAHACLDAIFVAGGECSSTFPRQEVCVTSGATEVIGVCDQICPDDDSVYNPGAEPVCRSVTMVSPFCDESEADQAEKCAKLLMPRYNGKLTLGFEIVDDGEPCCKSCTCYGDPECQAFDRSEDKWILCDARDDKCVTRESLCATQKDHVGNSCVWNQARADAIGNRRADIGAIGSPCQADFATSGDAYMTMYDTGDGFTARISMGERGVIETLELKTIAGTYTLVADTCFEDGNEWRVAPGSAPLATALDVVEDTENNFNNERNLLITDPVSQIFLRVVCIKRVSRDKQFTAYRMNIQNLVELDVSRQGSGYCTEENAVINKGNATTDTTEVVFDTCHVGNFDTAQQLCKVLWQPGCTPEQVKMGVEAWCTTANIYPDNTNRVSDCIKFIGTDGTKWAELYCTSVKNKRSPDLSEKQFINQCKSRIQVDGAFDVIDELGQGVLATGGSTLCGSSASSYAKRKPSEVCVPGLTVEFRNDQGEWEEVMFIPSTLPPCNNALDLVAAEFPELFTHVVRVRQCEVSRITCPIDVACLPNPGYEVSMTYTHDESICGNET